MGIAKKFGYNLKKVRLRNNLSRRQAAALVGISEAFWGYLERGERNPGFDVIDKIAKAFNISPHLLFVEGEAKINVEINQRLEKILTLGEEHKTFIIKFLDAYLEVVNK
ncbi:hypothetical protein JCM39194_15670 [Desulfotomaculum varum]